MKRRLLVPILVVALLSGCDGSGDRVLVNKYLYDTNLLPPSRYDVVVFKYPAEPIKDGTPKNYIKRLLGLPGEIIAIFFGQLYSFHHTGSGVPDGLSEEDWRKLTITDLNPLELWANPQKDHETAEKLWKLGKFKILVKPPDVMQALSRPVFDNDHQAKDLKKVMPPRWAPQSGAGWLADEPNGFKTDGAMQREAWLRYRHVLRPEDWPALHAPDRDAKIAEIASRVHWPQLITDSMGYNTYELDGVRKWPHYADKGGTLDMRMPANWVGDLMLECKLTVETPKGEFWMELSKGVDRFQARFDLATGECSLYRLTEHKTKEIDDNGAKKTVPDWQLLGPPKMTRVKASGTYALRFANYDERLTVWVDRDLPFEDGKAYPAPDKFGPDTVPDDDLRSLEDLKNNDLQPASMCSVGAALKVHNIKLWRDTYYTGSARDPSDTRRAIVGDDWKHPNKWGPLRALKEHTIYIYPGHFLCLGDNSPESSDSREWGLVPERLMLGRALMVYYPFDRAGVIK